MTAKLLPPIELIPLVKEALLKSAKSRISVFELFEEELLYKIKEPFAGRSGPILVQEVKEAHTTQRQANAWEEFCLLYLQARFPREYSKIWFWRDVPASVKKEMKLNPTKQDNGIDLIVKSKKGYIAVQCKFLAKGDLNYNKLSTFFTLCIPGNWQQRVVMTNAENISGKLPEIPGSFFYLRADFINTRKPIWLQMTKGIGETVDETLEVDEKPQTREELRLRHLAFFDKAGATTPALYINYHDLAEFCRSNFSPIKPEYYSEVHLKEIIAELQKLKLEEIIQPNVDEQVRKAEEMVKQIRRRINKEAPNIKLVILGLQGEQTFDGSLSETLVTYLQEMTN